tara:strand:+ start:43 stop:627 length:585 start_codon:yes stop_codon:yes gene_type:complete
MNKKTVTQIFLLLLVVVISLTIFLMYFNQELEPTNKVVSKNEIPKKTNEKSNIIKDIKYLSKDEGGNTYSIFAEYGEIKDQDPNIIYLKNVKAKISILNSGDINIKSDYAKYNNKSFDTNFYENIKVDYAEHKINCRYLDLSFDKKLAILYENISYKSLETNLFADRLEIDLISKNSTLSMKDKQEKIKIVYKQ